MFVSGMLVAGVAEGAELRTSTSLSGSWDSNVNSDSSDRASNSGDVRADAGVSFEVGSDRGGDAPWRLRYAPGYQMFVSNDGLDSWRHRVNGGFEYLFSRATTLSASGDFSRAIRSTLPSDADTSSDRLEPEETDEQIDIGSVGLGLSHRFSPRWGANANARYAFTNYDQEDRSDFESMTAGGTLTYRMASRQTLGAGFSLSRQVVTQADIRTSQGVIDASSDQETRFASLFGSWDYELGSLWSLNLRAGPTLIESDLQNQSIERVEAFRVPRGGEGRPLDARSCPRISEDPEQYVLAPDCSTLVGSAPVVDETTISYELSNPQDLENQGSSNTVFGSLAISRTGERTRFSLAYNRSASENFGGRTSTVADVLSSSLNWRPTQRWTVDARARYSVRTQATQAFVPSVVLVPNEGQIAGLDPAAAVGTGEIRAIEDDDFFDVESWVVSVQATRRLTRRLSGFVRAGYYDQQNRSPLEDVSVVRDFDRFDIGLGVTYVFEPIRL